MVIAGEGGGIFWNDGNVLYLDLGDSYIGE